MTTIHAPLLSLNEKLEILSDAAKYDVACTSSGVERRGKKGSLGNSCAAGICHSFAADGRCISLLKVLQSNECIYDCKYCPNRKSNDRVRTTFTPEELCTLVVEFYRRNYIEGLFLSSGVVKSPAYTTELMYRTLSLLRDRWNFGGYIHVKAIPNAPEDLLVRLGYLADRMSINLELATREGLQRLAPHKSHSSILTPMRRIQDTIADHRLSIGKEARMERSGGNRFLKSSIFSAAGTSDIDMRLSETNKAVPDQTAGFPGAAASPAGKTTKAPAVNEDTVPEYPTPFCFRPSKQDMSRRAFVPAGQSTQMIVGATAEDDRTLLQVTEALYRQYDLKRVFFSAYIPINADSKLPAPDTKPPLLREHRLYQADWLLRYYGFTANELLSPAQPNFNIFVDPKCNWALGHLERFPVEIGSADYETLLRVPGIGPKSALRIIKARRMECLDFDALKRIGVVLKRAKYFITCGGKMMYHIRIDEDFITRQLIGEEGRGNYHVEHPDTYRQLSLFDDKTFPLHP